MATVFLAHAATDQALDLHDATWAAVRSAMQERRPGPLREHRTSGLRYMVGGVDGAVVDRPDGLLLADGRPLVPGQDPRSDVGSCLRSVAAAWRDEGSSILPMLDGSFALWLFDAARGQVTLVRDRFGSRPLYWVAWNGGFFAASECKALAALGIPLHMARPVLEEVLLSRWIVGERHLLAPLKQVPAASAVTLGTGTKDAQAKRYWSLPFSPARREASGLEDYRDRTRSALTESIARVTNGGKKVGVLLSGGVDSSVIAGAARETVDECVAIVGRIPGTTNVELERARVVAGHLGIECRVVDISPDLGDTAIRDLVRRIEEPPRHPNNVVLQQLYAHAANEVDVVLHGDGAEMLFGLADVKRVARFRRKRALVRPVPAVVKRLVGRWLRSRDDMLAERAARVLLWDATTYAAMLDTIGYSPAVCRALRGASTNGVSQTLPTPWFSEYGSFADALQAYQAYTFLTCSLVRHDRLAQPLGLTSESPFLRAPVVDVCSRLPDGLRYTDGPKPVLRALCDFYLPAEVSRWPKLGFPVPWKEWLSRAMPAVPRGTQRLVDVLPPGFLEAAQAADDAEALWSAATLGHLIQQFGVDPTSEAL